MKYLFYCLVTPRGGPTPEIDSYERHAHSWREPKALRLEEKEKKNNLVRVGSKVAAEKLGVVQSRVHLPSLGWAWQE